MPNYLSIPFRKLLFISISIVCFASCKEKAPQFTIEGTIENADSATLYIERRSLSGIEVLDSIKLGKNGQFKFEQPALPYSEFYLLKLHNEIINLAIDSTETIKVKAFAQGFASKYNIEGSEASAKIKTVCLSQYKLDESISQLAKQFDTKKITAKEYEIQLEEAVNTYREVAREVIYSDPNSMAAYFSLFQQVKDYLIFDIYTKKDLSIFQMVATVWKLRKPDTPRTVHLEKFTLTALSELRNLSNKDATLNELRTLKPADSSELYNISLPTIANKTVSLSSLKGKVVILDFVTYDSRYAPAHNILLNKSFTKHKDRIEVYQVSLDVDEHIWKNAATNLPWICVRDVQAANSTLIQKFNIQALPTTFLLNKNGELVTRISSTDDLEAAIKRLL